MIQFEQRLRPITTVINRSTITGYIFDFIKEEETITCVTQKNLVKTKSVTGH